MAERIELSLTEDYIRSWTFYDAIRELVSNARDAEVAMGATMRVTHSGSTLLIENYGTTLPRTALLLGYTTKTSGGSTIGSFAEGLKLALLVLAREKVGVTIQNGNETWRPSIQRSEKYAANVLVVSISTKSTAIPRVSIQIDCSSDDWMALKYRFLWLSDPGNCVTGPSGTLLLEEKHKGSVYVKGVWIRKDAHSRYGYDFARCELDRDRRMVDSWESERRQRDIWREAFAAQPDLVLPKVEALMEAGAAEVRGFRYYETGASLQKALVASFIKKHGENSIPVASIEEARELEHFGKLGVLVSDEGLRKALQEVIGDFASIKKALALATLTVWQWDQLTAAEQAVYKACADRLAPLPPVEVVDFHEAGLLGTCIGVDKIQIARKLLASEKDCLRTLVHEVAHYTTGAGDGEKAHVSEIEGIWAALMFPNK